MKQRKDGRWVQSATINGKRHYFYSSETTEKRALKDIQRQMLDFQKENETGSFFSDVAQEWANKHFETIEHNTLKQYKPALRDVTEHFGTEPIKGITTAEIDRYIKAYAAQGFAQKTVKTRLLMLNLVFQYAYVKMYVDHNPCTYVTIPKNLPKKRRRALTAAEIEKVKTNTDCTFGVYALFLLYTGLRKGEALALKWKDIDFEKQVIHVTKTVEWIGNKPQIKNHPKTDKGERDVPLLDVLVSHLHPQKSNDLVFPNSDGTLIHNAHFTRLWNKYQSEAGLQDVTPHMLRHAYTTMLFEKGIDPKTAQNILGHANIQTTMDIYTHFTEEKLQETTKKLNSIIT